MKQTTNIPFLTTQMIQVKKKGKKKKKVKGFGNRKKIEMRIFLTVGAGDPQYLLPNQVHLPEMQQAKG